MKSVEVVIYLLPDVSMRLGQVIMESLVKLLEVIIIYRCKLQLGCLTT